MVEVNFLEAIIKTIGLLGGMSWESTALYYRLINEGIRARTEGAHAARIVMYSVDFHDIHRLQHQDRWEEAGQLLAKAAQHIETAGADFLLICTNTMHVVAPQVQAAITIPLLHLADTTADALHRDGITTAGLLGTRFTMEKNFYRDRLAQRHPVDCLIPPIEDRKILHRIIYDELVQGLIRPDSRRVFLRVINDLQDRGAQAIIAGCTEIGMLINQRQLNMPLYDTTVLHAQVAVDKALG